MTVYIVTDGEYSDYRIREVFTSKEKAELYCAVHENELDCPNIEEREADDVKLETDKPIMHRWVARIDEDGKILSVRHHLTIKDINEVNFNRGRWRGAYLVQATFDRDVTQGTAQKIMLDRLAKWKYEQLCKQLELFHK